MSWFGQRFLLPAAKIPENKSALSQIYGDFLQHVDLFRIIRPAFKHTRLGVYNTLPYVLCFTIVSFIGISFLATSIILVDDWGNATFSANMFIIYLTTAGVFYQLLKITWTKGVTTVDHLVTIIHGRTDHCMYAGTPYDKYLKKRTRRFLRLGYTIMLCGSTLMFTSYVVLPSAYDFIMNVPRASEVVNSGVSMTLSLPIWTPFDADHSWIGYGFVSMMQFGFFVVCSIAIGFGVFYNAICQLSIIDEMKLLIRAVDELEIRTEERFKKKFVGLPVDTSSEDYDNCFFECLRENIIHHQFIQKVFSQYQRHVSYTLAIPFFFSSIIIALCCAHLMSDDKNPVKKTIEVFHVSVDIMLMIMMCYFGQLIVDENDNFRAALYETGWMNRKKRVKQSISICMHVTYSSMQLLIGKIIILNHPNLLLIVKSAYSTFNLFYAAQNSS